MAFLRTDRESQPPSQAKPDQFVTHFSPKVGYKGKKEKSSMARSLPVENQLSQNVR